MKTIEYVASGTVRIKGYFSEKVCVNTDSDNKQEHFEMIEDAIYSYFSDKFNTINIQFEVERIQDPIIILK